MSYSGAANWQPALGFKVFQVPPVGPYCSLVPIRITPELYNKACTMRITWHSALVIGPWKEKTLTGQDSLRD